MLIVTDSVGNGSCLYYEIESSLFDSVEDHSGDVLSCAHKSPRSCCTHHDHVFPFLLLRKLQIRGCNDRGRDIDETTVVQSGRSGPEEWNLRNSEK